MRWMCTFLEEKGTFFWWEHFREFSRVLSMSYTLDDIPLLSDKLIIAEICPTQMLQWTWPSTRNTLPRDNIHPGAEPRVAFSPEKYSRL